MYSMSLVLQGYWTMTTNECEQRRRSGIGRSSAAFATLRVVMFHNCSDSASLSLMDLARPTNFDFPTGRAWVTEEVVLRLGRKIHSEPWHPSMRWLSASVRGTVAS